MAPISWRIEPIRTPQAISSPTSNMMSPNPCMTVSVVSAGLIPVASARATAPMTSATTGLIRKRTIMTTMPTIAAAVIPRICQSVTDGHLIFI